jgi:predicted glycoside hydrolase/deacetylase ChbG (UPF0249 family)
MAELCITADDYGMHPTVNAAIADLARDGFISAAAIMVHAGAHLDHVDALLDSGIALGLHVVLTQERPLLDSLVGTPLAPHGRLPESPYALARVLLCNWRLRGLLFAEIRAQASRYSALGLPMDFINSHEHVHEVPLLWAGFAELIEETEVRFFRSAHRQELHLSRGGALAALSKLSTAIRPVQGEPRVMSPLGAGQAGAMGLRVLEDLLQRSAGIHGRREFCLPELVVHPALDDAPLSEIWGAKVGARRAEFDTLRSPEWRALLDRKGLQVAQSRTL